MKCHWFVDCNHETHGDEIQKGEAFAPPFLLQLARIFHIASVTLMRGASIEISAKNRR